MNLAVVREPGTQDLSSLEDVVRRALDNERDALDQLVRALHGYIFGLALRMLGNREDAEDATQEILLRVLTRLATFASRSNIKTWVHRVAVNYILDVKKSAAERLHGKFERFSEGLTSRLIAADTAKANQAFLIEDIKIGSTLGMLQCLDRPHRAAYILGEIMQLPGAEAAEALRISPALFRKRLQRSRETILSFTRTYLGFAASSANRRPDRQNELIRGKRTTRRASGKSTTSDASLESIHSVIKQVDHARSALEIHKVNYPRRSSVDFARSIMKMLELATRVDLTPRN